jgi:hypothetical protein
MPISRRRVREPSPADIIEEDDPSQQVQDDDVDESEPTQPKRKAKQPMIKKEKKATKGKEKAQNESDDGEGYDGEDRIDVENFQDQPLEKADVGRLTGLGKDWAAIRQGLQASSFQMLNDIAAALAEADEDNKVH